MGCQKEAKSAVSLLAIRQGREETLWEYVSCFQEEALCIAYLDVSITTTAPTQGS